MRERRPGPGFRASRAVAFISSAGSVARSIPQSHLHLRRRPRRIRRPRVIAHRFAMFRALPADAHALIHVADLLAAIGTSPAHFSAGSAYCGMQRRFAEHEVHRSLAQLGAIDHQAEMFGLDVFSALLEAVSHCHVQTGFMACPACRDAILQVSVLLCRDHICLLCRMTNAVKGTARADSVSSGKNGRKCRAMGSRP